MGNFEKHVGIAREKLKITRESFVEKSNTVVGDLNRLEVKIDE